MLTCFLPFSPEGWIRFNAEEILSFHWFMCHSDQSPASLVTLSWRKSKWAKKSNSSKKSPDILSKRVVSRQLEKALIHDTR